jgi:2-polyprenyl-3-methyl-5-hydroxy-6-metoxy-1,4-benzoquinol methylase
MTALQAYCNLCGHNNFRIIEKDEFPFQVLKCGSCGLVFVHPHPGRDQLKSHYCENYYSEWINQQKNKRTRMWISRLNRIKKLQACGRLLDVGCGEGLFLSLAQDSGWQISGTELSPYASKFASKALGTEIYDGQLHNASFADNSFDVVTMWHVLEHVEDPISCLSEVHRVLRPHGLLVLAVPNANDLVMQMAYRIIRRRRLKLFSIYDKEVHLYHFSPKTLNAYLEKTGFDCLRISPDYGIVKFSKKLINWISVIPFYIAGFKIFNAIEASAVPRK